MIRGLPRGLASTPASRWTRQAITHLLSGLRADGEAIAGKQIQKPTRSVASVFGLDDDGLPSADAVEAILQGKRADGLAPMDATGQALSDTVVDGARKRFLAAYGVSGREPTDEQIDAHQGRPDGLGRQRQCR